MSFICIPPGSAVVYRVIVYIIMYLLAGVAMRKTSAGAPPEYYMSEMRAT